MLANIFSNDKLNEVTQRVLSIIVCFAILQKQLHKI